MENEKYVFVVSDYYATGEGRTISFLITRAYPHTGDYEVAPSFTPDGYVPGKLANTAEERALREMQEFIGGWFALGSEIFTREKLLASYRRFLPQYVIEFLEDPEGDTGNFNFKSQIHVNYA